MQHRASVLSALAAAAILVGCGSSAHAAPATYVSGTGVNAGACVVSAPCATFQYAHNQTDAGGVISVVSAGSFGPVAITKSISIIAADGVLALIQVANTSACGTVAICVAAGATDIVYLRGIVVDLNQSGANGIGFTTGGTLRIQNFVVRRIAGVGKAIYFAPTGGASDLYVSDTLLADSFDGIRITPMVVSGFKVVLDRVRVENIGAYGIIFEGLLAGNFTVGAVIRDSLVSKVVLTGIYAANNASGGKMDVTVDRTTVVNTQIGVRSFNAGATVRVGNSTITGNGTGVSATSGGVVALYPTNMTEGNGNDVLTSLGMRPFRGDRAQ